MLDGTKVSDLKPLEMLSNLELLWLDETRVTDLRPLKDLSKLMALGLGGCPVDDLRPLLSLNQLTEREKFGGDRISFYNCGASKLDTRIAEISRIDDNIERARLLFDYLVDWVPPWEQPEKVIASPKPTLAPLQTQITNGRLQRIGNHNLPEMDAMQRAEAGWRALKQFREVFGNSCNVHNYSQLVAVLSGFDMAMGDSFQPDSMILIGVMGRAIIALSDDSDFNNELPTGADALLNQFGVEIDTYLNRFPDWTAYLEDSQKNAGDAVHVSSEQDAFEAIEAALIESDETDEDVATDYSLQVRHGAHEGSAPEIATGLVASTREVARALSEVAVEEVRSGRIAVVEVDALEAVHDTELAKVKWYAGGFAIVFLRRRDPHLRKLSKRFPTQLGWLERVLDYISADSTQN